MIRISAVCCLISLWLVSTAAQAQSIQDLPEYPLHVQYKKSLKPILLYLSGDGGWNTFSEDLVAELGKNGYPVIALDTRKYFWNEKTPDQFARDIRQILTAYAKAWNKDAVVLIGYSFGADVGAFLPARLATLTKPAVTAAVLLSPGLSTGYVVKLKSMLNFGSTNKEKYKVYPEMLKAKVPVWCIFGQDEDSDFYPLLRETATIHKTTVPGSHRYDDQIPVLVKAILKGLP